MYKIIFIFELSLTGLCIKKCSDQVSWLLNGIKIISHLHSIQNKSGKRRRQVFNYPVWYSKQSHEHAHKLVAQYRSYSE